ncbi:MBL fold metallo-hydrolase [bacterium]|nr:MBL fold metallo-hydrolase [bacterium]
MKNGTYNVIRFRMQFVSAYLLRGRDGYVLFDSGYPYFERLFKRRCRQNGLSADQIRLILLSHGHIDHVGGARALSELTGAPVAIDRRDAACLTTGRFAPLIPRTWLGWLTTLAANRQVLPPNCRFTPDILLDGELDLNEYGVAGRAFHTPGHTQGSLSVILDSGEAVIGDAVMVNFPFLSEPSYPIYADDLDQVRASVAKILAVKPRIIYTSHGGPVTPEAVRRRYRL